MNSNDNVVYFPPSPETRREHETRVPEIVEVRYHLRARNSKDWSVVDSVFDDAEEAAECARRLYKSGYDVSCDMHQVYAMARWTHEDSHTEGDVT